MDPLRDVLISRFGDTFPVGDGTSKRDDPLVITAQKDYVSIEYAVATFLLDEMGFEYEFDKQQCHKLDGRVVDELIYATRESGETEWTQTRRFFFDVTAGFNRSSEPPKPRHPIPRILRTPASHYSTPPTPSRAAHYARLTIRWLAFLPLAFLASWLATRFAMFFRFGEFNQTNNPYVVLLFMQALSGAMIGWVGVKIAPGAKTFALACCVALSAAVAIAYFLRFNDLVGGLAAVIHVTATVISGFFARDD